MNAQLWWQTAVAPLSGSSRQAAIEHQNQLTKPPGALGQLEQVAIDLAAMQHQTKPCIKQPQLIVFAGDHGVVAQGVSAFPQSVTIAMLANFVAGGAAVSVLAKLQGIGLSVVNCGTATPCSDMAGVIHCPVMAGTQDFSEQAAMSEAQALASLNIGAEQIERLQATGCDLFIAGEMGIGNTSAASAMAAALLKLDVAQLVGPGTGVQGAALAHKQQVLSASLARAQPLLHNPLQVLVQLGGLEIGAMAGAYLRAAQLGIPSLVDGFIASTAALLAVHLNPSVRGWLLFGHQSAEPGHLQVLKALQAQPLLQLGMRLGEGSGAAAAYALVQQALAIHSQMATFAEAQIAGQL